MSKKNISAIRKRIDTHPGEILREEYLIPMEMSARALARALNVPPNRITQIIAEKRDVTADTAIRLARAFDTSPEFWLNLQLAHDLSKAQAEGNYCNIESIARATVEAA
jgi:addiction module HigA family antidote